MTFAIETNNSGVGELLTGCKFYLEADGISDKLILEVSGLSVESKVAGEKVSGSGRGGQKLRQATPTSETFEHLKIKVAATVDLDLYDWYKNCNDNAGGASQWASNRKALSVSAYNQAGEMKARWEVVNCYPCKYSGPEFKSEDENLANETIECTHEGIHRVQ
ncbi:MAG: phage tail protein [Prochloraceae cyanobacterium]|nr:phage tail protein [Prochloraceae cyanobacterium]